MTNEYIFYTQIASIITYVALIFGLYRLLVTQKDSVIELLKTRNELLERRISELDKQSPDSLLESLSRRIALAKGEIESRNQDREKHQSEIAHKERGLQELSDRLDQLQDLLKHSDLVCPECEAPLIRSDCHTISHMIGGREVEADVHYSEYECGYAVSDDRIEPLTPCGANRKESV